MSLHIHSEKFTAQTLGVTGFKTARAKRDGLRLYFVHEEQHQRTRTTKTST